MKCQFNLIKRRQLIVNPFVNLSEFELFFKEEALHQVPTKFIQKENSDVFFFAHQHIGTF